MRSIPTSSWLQRFRKSQNINFHNVCNEKWSADIIDANEWSRLPSLIKDYQRCNIYNCDETGLYYKELPKGTMEFSGTQLGFKPDKEKVSVLYIINGDGSDKKLYVVGKFKNPRCFKNKKLSVKYYYNKSSRMTTSTFEDILKECDSSLNKKILLFCDNASCHKTKLTFNNIKLIILSANTTSLIQPLDIGAIRSFKCHYRKGIMRKMITLKEENDTTTFYKRFTLYDSLYLIKFAWGEVTSTAIIKCFTEAKFFDKSMALGWESEDDIALTDNEDEFDPIFVEYALHDDDASYHGILDDQDICNQIRLELEEGYESSDNDEKNLVKLFNYKKSGS
ncbi:jerky protein homolog-like [Gordionus sp. m RMFG-2023]|uniref:jerky protein homolog-like n=1 Tax=Gordionus sp. m RMFG-2023 TaxID=3053472 RepID=UPI0031FBE8A5